MLRLSEIALWTRGGMQGKDLMVRGVATDTREAMPGALFVALKGENFDGHDFIGKAKEAGAIAALVERPLASDLPQVIVADTLLALGDLASHARAQHRARVVGITGSNGKTTVKSLVAAILSLHGKTHVNAGNYNNEIGLPLSLLAMPEDTQYAVFEMGAGKPGDIDYLASIARPEIGLVNNIGPAHLERMGSLEGIAETKGALYAALPAHGVAVINADEAFANLFTSLNRAERVIRFGLDKPADVSAEIRKLGAESRFALRTPNGSVEIALPLAGRHNVANALAAAAIALALDVPLATIERGLESAPAVKGRLVRHAMPGGWTLIDDSYNANPASTAAAIATLVEAPEEAWLVLGDMRELGPQARELHAQTGALAKKSGIAWLYTVGELSRAAAAAFGEGAQHFADQESLTRALAADVRAGVNVLVKGSRGSAMDKVVKALLDDKGGNGGTRHAA
ncbi:MAG: UDP-N-acetylmuramoyl-tripeptide--D-alanyl-D-alanine ligase [Rudaea sp.]|uniref:UDP-N-acetylmuramoyl-tripeptide--D-alanyl-D- alanine ligase n=1 Tax=unclassified Rudaea TaxID=2627037 RepID=UPI0010F7E240|nr:MULTISPECIES: UDP-N-acetylmuramoyl-tripeptide--D-alanyl-D-alanine ligase [unclassified Rudaea]MBN8887355.1 UDP-N-acetylmuramoyl-tripeptide--D-alanyl-D-alanine ligase [Rudaea sp.]MBR0344841.1 UDP-N-acetylmuramoyl-tripeptide--D-alanyl-D-alanine ligase [Rudaea sp.]